MNQSWPMEGKPILENLNTQKGIPSINREKQSEPHTQEINHGLPVERFLITGDNILETVDIKKRIMQNENS
jgi:hypothetical protein